MLIQRTICYSRLLTSSTTQKRAGKHRCTSTTSVRCFRIETKGHQKPGRSTRMTPPHWQPRVWTALLALSQILEPNYEANRPTNSSKKVVYTVRKKTAPRQQGKLETPNRRESQKRKSSTKSARTSKSRRHVCIRIKTTQKKTDWTQDTQTIARMKIPVPRIISTVDIANGDDSEIQDAKEKEKTSMKRRQTDRFPGIIHQHTFVFARGARYLGETHVPS